MHIRALTTLGTLCAVAVLATAAGTAPVTRPAPAPTEHSPQQRTGLPVLVDCLWHPHVRPSDFMLACGDGNSRLASLSWSRWDAETARAEGVNWVNDCKPYCAAGRFHAYPVTVRLDDPQPWKKRPGLSRYSRITLEYADSRPEQFSQTVSYPLWD
ncbi:hypothetical protein [Streptomyces sp. S.PB5]|uniref:hypothetical protein n=1 Tax=Streptomyces sp. S.PB5 TaxID=3020844 RepID=UPI0025AED675|nr:hypothetical protein [Streptomyces sp. S.PB5]MDN3027886.1 hypothetical protein [Streptomyces sp. S.PB5]